MDKEPEFTDSSGIARKTHYGPPGSKQPWDTIVELGWGPYFAASNVLKYLRRTKQIEDSQEKAKWYWAELSKLCKIDVNAIIILAQLTNELTDAEYNLVNGG